MHVKEYRTHLRQVSLPEGLERVARALRLIVRHAGPAGDPCLAGLVERAATLEENRMLEEVAA